MWDSPLGQATRGVQRWARTTALVRPQIQRHRRSTVGAGSSAGARSVCSGSCIERSTTASKMRSLSRFARGSVDSASSSPESRYASARCSAIAPNPRRVISRRRDGRRSGTRQRGLCESEMLAGPRARDATSWRGSNDQCGSQSACRQPPGRALFPCVASEAPFRAHCNQSNWQDTKHHPPAHQRGDAASWGLLLPPMIDP